MRLAVFSDVHGQVERLSACLHSIARVGADELWCLGDAVDAFAVRQPELIVACVNAIDDVCAVKLTGNHEAWALQDGSLPTAASAVLAAWTVAAHREGVLAVHGSPQNPLMGYMSDEQSVRAAIERLPGWLCVHGHTHQALLWISEKDGTLQRQRRPSSQKLRRSARAIACPGAITGPQPRWLLVDTDRRRLTWHSIDAVANATAPYNAPGCGAAMTSAPARPRRGPEVAPSRMTPATRVVRRDYRTPAPKAMDG